MHVRSICLKKIYRVEHFRANVLKLKETYISTKHYRLKNPNWQEADHLTLYKHDRGVELGSTKKTTPIKWSERDLSPRPPEFKSGDSNHSATLPHAILERKLNFPCHQVHHVL